MGKVVVNEGLDEQRIYVVFEPPLIWRTRKTASCFSMTKSICTRLRGQQTLGFDGGRATA
jgi:hypothetical protein